MSPNDQCKIAKKMPGYGECNDAGGGVYMKSTCGHSIGFIIGVVVGVLVLVGGGAAAFFLMRGAKE
jgi:hypothetical protein